MSDLIFRGVAASSLDDVYIQKMPDHRKASMRYSEYYVKGRDGALHVDEGLANFDLTATLIMINGLPATRQLINAWADGTGKLISSDQPGFAYEATVKEEIQWTRVLSNKIDGVQRFHDAAVITWNCQPYMVEAVDSVIVLDEPGETSAFTNPGSATALPFIEVNGSGDAVFSVNGNEISIADMTSGVPVYLDSATGYVYTAEGATAMTGDFPVFEMGENTITLGTGVTSLRITPHWRWI